MADGLGDKKYVGHLVRNRTQYGKPEYFTNTRIPCLERTRNARRHLEFDILELQTQPIFPSSEPASSCDAENHSPFLPSHLDPASSISSDDWFQCERVDYISDIAADEAASSYSSREITTYQSSGRTEDDYLEQIPQCIFDGRNSTSFLSIQKIFLPNDSVDIVSTQPSAPNSPSSPQDPCVDGQNDIVRFNGTSYHTIAGHYREGRNGPCQPAKRSHSKTCLNRVINSCDSHDNQKTAYPLPLPPPQNEIFEINIENSSSIKPNLIADDMQTSSSKASHLNPTSTKWSKGKLLGSGSFGKVYRGHNRETGELCAIKEVEVSLDDPRSKECCEQLAQEIALLRILRHPNILHYKDSEMVGGSLYIYLELVSGGSIYRLLQEFGKFTEPVIQRYTIQILQGLQYLHGKNTVHRDIKCANILVDEDGKVKLADFGTAKIIADDMAPLSFKGSPYWMAPEVIMQINTGFELAADIWSLGCTVIEMTTGKPPWFEYEGFQALCKIMKAHEIPIPSSLSPEGQHFVRLCLLRDPAKRPSATELLNHPFVDIHKRV